MCASIATSAHTQYTIVVCEVSTFLLLRYAITTKLCSRNSKVGCREWVILDKIVEL
jgi:hypothetical protein